MINVEPSVTKKSTRGRAKEADMVIDPKSKVKLTPRQARFVKDYLKTGNATEAAEKNYNVKDRYVAGSIGSENLQKPEIKAAIGFAPDIVAMAKAQIAKLAEKAEQETVRLQASRDIVDRSEGKPTQPVDAKGKIEIEFVKKW